MLYRRAGGVYDKVLVGDCPDLEAENMNRATEIVPVPLPVKVPVTLNVLAVDDNPIDRTIISRLLQTSSFNVITLDSPLRALEILGVGKEPAEPVLKMDLIFTDYSMPDMTGYEFLKKLKSFPALSHIPVVFVSSENERQRINSCIEEGARDFIHKPVKLADIKRIVGSLRSDDVEALSGSSSSSSRSWKRPLGTLEQDESKKQPRLTV